MRWDEWRGSLDGRPVMWTRNLVAFHGWRLDLHKFVAADAAGCLHTHPANAWRLIVWGGYFEEVEGSTAHKEWRPGMFGRVKPSLSHRVAALRNGRSSYSLWLRAPKTHDVQLRGQGWTT